MLPFPLDGRMSPRRVDALEAEGMGMKKGNLPQYRTSLTQLAIIL